MDKSYIGHQKTKLDPTVDYGMAQDDYNLKKRYGLKSGATDQYRGVPFTLTPRGNYRVDKPVAIAGEYTNRKLLMEAIDAIASAHD